MRFLCLALLLVALSANIRADGWSEKPKSAEAEVKNVPCKVLHGFETAHNALLDRLGVPKNIYQVTQTYPVEKKVGLSAEFCGDQPTAKITITKLGGYYTVTVNRVNPQKLVYLIVQAYY